LELETGCRGFRISTPDTLTEAQRELLRVCPAYLPKKQRKRYREAVLDAPWLEPVDLGFARGLGGDVGHGGDRRSRA
jgi:hypothetical protein